MSLEKYILEELNVKSLVVTSEREKFGVELKAIPDIKVLGMRLKNDSKKVIAAIKELDDDQLQAYQKDSSSFSVAGHQLEQGELKILYTLGKSDGDTDPKYEAHAVGEILVLLNIRADADMINEGIAREVINRVQKLRKKAHLVPTDSVTVWYKISKSEAIANSVQSFNEFISTSLKAPFKPLPVVGDENVVISETQELKESQVEIVITGVKK